MPAARFLAQSCARDLCQSMELIPELSASAGFQLIPNLRHFKAREPQAPKPKGSREGCSRLLGEELEAGAAWSPPAISTPQPKWIQTSSKGCSSQAQAPSSQARQKQHKHLLSPAHPSCFQASWLQTFPTAPCWPLQSGEPQVLTPELAEGHREGVDGPSEAGMSPRALKKSQNKLK